MAVMGLEMMRRLGIKVDELIPASLRITTADVKELEVIGAVILSITAKNCKTTHQMTYVARQAVQFSLPNAGLQDIGFVGPEAKACLGTLESGSGVTVESEVLDMKEIDVGEAGDSREECGCLKRTPPPPLPDVISFEPVPEDVDKLHDWIITRYKSSAFNQCTHKPLPMVRTKPPLKLYVDPDTKPVAVHNPAQVPLHFMESVLEGLEKDVRLGVLERVPVNTPSSWCSRMVVCTKKDGKPCRTIDFKAVNASSPRQTHVVESPYLQASGIPAHTWRTSLDCWEDYHSLPLDPEDKDFTTFVTPWGRYLYLVAPQGFLSSNDGYCQRFDEVTKDVDKLKRCVDDNLLWADSIEEMFWRTCKYLELTSSNGYIMNTNQFVFCVRELEFVGYWDIGIWDKTYRRYAPSNY